MADYSEAAYKFEQTCIRFYEAKNYTVRGVTDKAVRAILEIPGWQINLTKKPQFHVHPEQGAWRQEGERHMEKACDFLVEIDASHWILAEAKRRKRIDRSFILQLEHTGRLAQQKNKRDKKEIDIAFHLLIPQNITNFASSYRLGTPATMHKEGAIEAPLCTASGPVIILGKQVSVISLS